MDELLRWLFTADAPAATRHKARLLVLMQMPEVRERMAGMGSTIVASRPEEFRAFLEKEIQQWAEAVRISGAKAE